MVRMTKWCSTTRRSRAHEHVARFLGTHFNGTLLSDGYDAYARYAGNNSTVTHAGCWAHSRRHFEQAREAEPHATSEALALIGRLYQPGAGFESWIADLPNQARRRGLQRQEPQSQFNIRIPCRLVSVRGWAVHQFLEMLSRP